MILIKVKGIQEPNNSNKLNLKNKKRKNETTDFLAICYKGVELCILQYYWFWRKKQPLIPFLDARRVTSLQTIPLVTAAVDRSRNVQPLPMMPCFLRRVGGAYHMSRSYNWHEVLRRCPSSIRANPELFQSLEVHP